MSRYVKAIPFGDYTKGIPSLQKKKHYIKGYGAGPRGGTLPRYKAWLTEHPLPCLPYKAGDSVIF